MTYFGKNISVMTYYNAYIEFDIEYDDRRTVWHQLTASVQCHQFRIDERVVFI